MGAIRVVSHYAVMQPMRTPSRDTERSRSGPIAKLRRQSGRMQFGVPGLLVGVAIIGVLLMFSSRYARRSAALVELNSAQRAHWAETIGVEELCQASIRWVSAARDDPFADYVGACEDYLGLAAHTAELLEAQEKMGHPAAPGELECARRWHIHAQQLFNEAKTNGRSARSPFK